MTGKKTSASSMYLSVHPTRYWMTKIKDQHSQIQHNCPRKCAIAADFLKWSENLWVYQFQQRERKDRIRDALNAPPVKSENSDITTTVNRIFASSIRTSFISGKIWIVKRNMKQSGLHIINERIQDTCHHVKSDGNVRKHYRSMQEAFETCSLQRKQRQALVTHLLQRTLM